MGGMTVRLATRRVKHIAGGSDTELQFLKRGRSCRFRDKNGHEKYHTKENEAGHCAVHVILAYTMVSASNVKRGGLEMGYKNNILFETL